MYHTIRRDMLYIYAMLCYIPYHANGQRGTDLPALAHRDRLHPYFIRAVPEATIRRGDALSRKLLGQVLGMGAGSAGYWEYLLDDRPYC